MKNLSMSSTMTERTPLQCYDTGVTPQQCYEGGGVTTHYSEKRSPLTSQVLAIITGLHVGCILLALAGLFLLGTLTGLVVTTPLFILFSPVLVPATIVIGLAVAGFLMSAVFGLTALSSLSWAMKYIRQTQGTVAEQLELEKQCMAKWWSEWCNMKVFFIFITKAAICSLSFSLDPHNHRFNTTTAKTTRRFLTNSELTTMQHLESFLYSQTIKSGSIWIRVMRDNEIDPLVCLLADTFAEMMMFPKSYINMLRFLLKQNLIKRRTLMPHIATLIGFYRGVVDGEEDEEMQLAGTVEICFDKNGANSSLPSPTPPKDSPYISSVAVDKSFRRRGIGRHLLKASEELISRICLSGEVYLHCRMTDEAPFNLYTKADYKIVMTDSILVLVMLERRNHLMCKKLPLISMPSEIDVPCSDDNE